jgi:cytoskeletal protein CcmA (bactofilin family)
VNRGERPLNAYLGRGATYQGDLSFEGRVRVDGLFRGRIYSDEMLEIGVEGRIEGEVDAQEVILSGRIDGQLRVRGLLRITSTGRIDGRVDAHTVTMEPGAIVRAVVRIGDTASLGPDLPETDAR